MSLWQWSTTPASNATAGAINWAEGQAPSTVNDSARQMMADVATWFQSPEWLNYGLTPTYVNATTFTVTGNQTPVFSVGRRIKASVTAGSLYGTIATSAFTSLTTVTVTWDSGNLDSGLSEIDVGILNPLFSSLPAATLQSPMTIGTPALPNQTVLNFVNNTNNVALFQHQADGSFGLFDNARSQLRWISDASGNFTATGLVTGSNLTASSDERLKKDWEPMPIDLIDRLATIKDGTYTRIDNGQRQVGVSAQSLQLVMREAVIESEEGMLSVAYGHAALVACVELAKEVVRLRSMLEPVK